MLKRTLLSALTLGTIALAQPAFASFHLMQIEQVIGGVNGDTSRQAIQLRMRFAGQNLVQQGQLVAWNAAGASPVVVLDIGAMVTNSAGGARIVIATSNFMPGFTPDFVMTNPIPASYLAAGKLTFETDGTPGSSVWWGLAWGGASYTGTNTGNAGAISVANDLDGNFNPPFAGPLPSSNTQALQFTGASGNQSTTNAADYALTAGAAVFTKNNGTTTTVPVELMEFKIQ
jgi:hypothetical protein